MRIYLFIRFLNKMIFHQQVKEIKDVSRVRKSQLQKYVDITFNLCMMVKKNLVFANLKIYVETKKLK